MEKGMAIIEVTDKKTTGIFIDEEQLEFVRQNAYTKRRREERARNEQEAERNRRRAEKAAAQRKRHNIQTFTYIGSRLVVCGAVALAGAAGLIHPVIYIPAVLLCLSTACLRLGAWFGKARC